MMVSSGPTLTVVSLSGGSVTPNTERPRQAFTFGKARLYLFYTSFAELGQLTLKFRVAAVMNQDRRSPRHHIIRMRPRDRQVVDGGLGGALGDRGDLDAGAAWRSGGTGRC